MALLTNGVGALGTFESDVHSGSRGRSVAAPPSLNLATLGVVHNPGGLRIGAALFRVRATPSASGSSLSGPGLWFG